MQPVRVFALDADFSSVYRPSLSALTTFPPERPYRPSTRHYVSDAAITAIEKYESKINDKVKYDFVNVPIVTAAEHKAADAHNVLDDDEQEEEEEEEEEDDDDDDDDDDMIDDDEEEEEEEEEEDSGSVSGLDDDDDEDSASGSDYSEAPPEPAIWSTAPTRPSVSGDAGGASSAASPAVVRMSVQDLTESDDGAEAAGAHSQLVRDAEYARALALAEGGGGDSEIDEDEAMQIARAIEEADRKESTT